ncbi:MAG: GNAT family N-acetyltransferase, partial [Ruminiclostridium sp.]
SDGGYITFIADVMVLPEYQKNNIGKTMLNMMMSHIKSNLNIGDSVNVALMSAKGKENFYKQFGFEERPNDNAGAGMTQWISKQEIEV